MADKYWHVRYKDKKLKHFERHKNLCNSCRLFNISISFFTSKLAHYNKSYQIKVGGFNISLWLTNRDTQPCACQNDSSKFFSLKLNYKILRGYILTKYIQSWQSLIYLSIWLVSGWKYFLPINVQWNKGFVYICIMIKVEQFHPYPQTCNSCNNQLSGLSSNSSGLNSKKAYVLLSNYPSSDAVQLP